MGADGDDRVDDALWVAGVNRLQGELDASARIERLFEYLETFPTGVHNRRAAEAIEELLYEVRDARHRAELRTRLRAVRDPHMPPLEPNTWIPFEDASEE